MNNRKKSVIENKRSNQITTNQPKESREENEVKELRETREPVHRDISPKQKRKKNSKGKKFFKSLLILIIFLFTAGFAINAFFLKDVTSDLNRNFSRYNVSKEAAAIAKQHKIANIAVFGIDGRDDVEGERTDAIMIASADFEHGKVKITSLMRDTYVYINEKYGYDKLNSAYAYGGASLALQTINQNFDTPISDYVAIDFNAMVIMVNAVGGITLDIKTEEELKWVNEYINDVNAVVASASDPLNALGSQVVDGTQALAYCRVRYAGDGDFERTLRQRAVFEQVLAKALDLKLMDQYNLLMSTLPYIKTSLSPLELIKYAINLALMPGKNIEQNRFPSDEFIALDTIDGASYVITDTLVDNIKALYWFIYEATYTPSQTAMDRSEKISEDLLNYSNDEYTYTDEESEEEFIPEYKKRGPYPPETKSSEDTDANYTNEETLSEETIPEHKPEYKSQEEVIDPLIDDSSFDEEEVIDPKIKEEVLNEEDSF